AIEERRWDRSASCILVLGREVGIAAFLEELQCLAILGGPIWIHEGVGVLLTLHGIKIEIVSLRHELGYLGRRSKGHRLEGKPGLGVPPPPKAEGTAKSGNQDDQDQKSAGGTAVVWHTTI